MPLNNRVAEPNPQAEATRVLQVLPVNIIQSLRVGFHCTLAEKLSPINRRVRLVPQEETAGNSGGARKISVVAVGHLLASPIPRSPYFACYMVKFSFASGSDYPR
jgi:hypothetical protein